MTPQNLFMRINRDAFGWSEGRLTVDYERLVLSAGPVRPVVFEAPVLDSDNVLTVKFKKHRPGGGGDAFDSVFVVVYNPEEQLGYMAAPALRREGRVSFVLPDWMLGGELQMWGFVQDERGRCSETLYIGHGETVAALEPVTSDAIEDTEITRVQDIAKKVSGQWSVAGGQLADASMPRRLPPN